MIAYIDLIFLLILASLYPYIWTAQGD